MVSRFYRQRSDSKTGCEHIGNLLQDGARFKEPSAELMAAAEHLSHIGIIDVQRCEFVQCANPADGDFPPRNRHCNGRVYMGDGLHDAGGELRCPECERRVFPDQYLKQRFTELRVHVLREGVLAYLRSILQRLGQTVQEMSLGVFRIEIGGDGVDVCIVEYAEPKYLARERAIQHPSCFIAVNPQDFDGRFLEEDWVRRTTLAHVICGTVDLGDLVRLAATGGVPTHVRQASIPVYSKGPTSVIVEPLRPSAPERRFVVEVGPKIVRVEGLKVVAEQAGPRFLLFRALWLSFLSDLKDGLPPEEFHAKPLKKLIEELEEMTNRKSNDEMTVRRAINRLQLDIEQSIRKNRGLPVDREDIIQICPQRSQSEKNYGYRINPFTVVARPFQSNLS